MTPGHCLQCGKKLYKRTKHGHCAQHYAEVIRPQLFGEGRVPPHQRERYRQLVKKLYTANSVVDHLLCGGELQLHAAYRRKREASAKKVAFTKPLATKFIDEVSAISGVHRRDILGDYRFGFTVDARAVIAICLRRRGVSYPVIGKALNRDHTSIINLVRTFDKRVEANPDLAVWADRVAPEGIAA